MVGNEQSASVGTSSRPFLPVVGVFAAGFVHSVLPHGLFGTHDFAARAAVAGVVAGVTTLLLFVLTRRWSAR